MKMRKNKIIIEFNTSNMPARSLLTNFVGKFNYPVKIDATKGFKMIFQVNHKQEKYSEFMINKSLKMAEYLYDNLQ